MVAYRHRLLTTTCLNTMFVWQWCSPSKSPEANLPELPILSNHLGGHLKDDSAINNDIMKTCQCQNLTWIHAFLYPAWPHYGIKSWSPSPGLHFMSILPINCVDLSHNVHIDTWHLIHITRDARGAKRKAKGERFFSLDERCIWVAGDQCS